MATEKKIEELKAKYSGLFKMEVPMSDGTTEELILRDLDRKTFAAVSKIAAKDELQSVEVFLRSLTVDGDAEKVIKDFKALLSASHLVTEIIEVKPGNVARL